jgi:uracil-DNA glycosylase family 4
LTKVSDVPACTGCPWRGLYPNSIYVPPSVAHNSKRVAIGEKPGEDEMLQGQPFVGGSGRLVQISYSKAGVRWNDVTKTNVVNCRDVLSGNIFPTDPDGRAFISKEGALGSVRHCLEHHVYPLLRSLQPTRIDLIGDKPLQFVAGLHDGILKWRGSPLKILDSGTYNALATVHPAFVMRNGQEWLPVQVNDLAKGLVPPPEAYTLYPDIAQVQAFDKDTFAFDLETNYPAFPREVTLVGVCSDVGQSVVIPARGQYLTALRTLFQRARTIVGQNIVQFDLPELRKLSGIGIDEDRCTVFDTMLMQHLCFPDLPHDLEFIGSQFTNKPAWKHLRGAAEELYNARDVDVTWQAYLQLRPLLEQNKLGALYHFVQVPIAKICKLMTDTGIAVDPNNLKSVRTKLLAEMEQEELLLPAELRTRKREVMKRQLAPPGTLSPKTGKPLKYIRVPDFELDTPWRSGDVVKEYLYETLHLPVQVHPKTHEPTADKGAIDKLYRRLVNGTIRLENAREVAKGIYAIKNLRAKSNLISGFVQDSKAGVGRVHASFNVHGTAGGRLSSSGPNLQNQPESARYIYVPSHPDWCLIDIDFGSIENRLTAWYSNDRERLNRWALDPNFNEHKWTTSVMFGIPIEDVIKDNDRDAPYGKAKRIGHGRNYGMGVKKICNLFDLEFSEVKDAVEKLTKAMPVLTRWQAEVAAQAKRDGVLTNAFGRKRWFVPLGNWYTEALSFLPQSTAADIIFRAMIGLMYERIGWPVEKALKVVQVVEPLPQPARLLLQVHDSLVFEAPAGQVDEVVGVVRRVMTQPFRELGGYSIPVGVQVAPAGCSWGEVKPYK